MAGWGRGRSKPKTLSRVFLAFETTLADGGDLLFDSFCEIADWLREKKSLFYLHIQAGCQGRNEAVMSSMPLECWVFVFHIHLLVFRLFLLWDSPLFTEDSNSEKTTEISTLLHFEESDGLRGFLFTPTNATWAIFSGNLEWEIYPW